MDSDIFDKKIPYDLFYKLLVLAAGVGIGIGFLAFVVFSGYFMGPSQHADVNVTTENNTAKISIIEMNDSQSVSVFLYDGSGGQGKNVGNLSETQDITVELDKYAVGDRFVVRSVLENDSQKAIGVYEVTVEGDSYSLTDRTNRTEG